MVRARFDPSVVEAHFEQDFQKSELIRDRHGLVQTDLAYHRERMAFCGGSESVPATCNVEHCGNVVVARRNIMIEPSVWTSREPLRNQEVMRQNKTPD